MTARQLSDLQLIGDTDRLHAADDNQALSERRAEAMRDGSVAGGIAAYTIQSKAGDPLAQSPGPASPEVIDCPAPNRRVEISGLIAARD
ncbi:hypothetical protein [Pseudoxanthomonas sp. GM95]|uniref:hypothetical protein n=1 Tax=Pseudoxanthomonas sp. GM95 TaxID=1881043 RepID=UPI001C313BEC|nr:hypothetical protein [Pseudoxanthomonas sp. GM95]